MRRNRCTGTEPLAVRLQVGCLGWLRACFKAVLKAHSPVYGWLIGSRVGASSVSEEGWFGRPSGSGRNGCRRFCAAWCKPAYSGGKKDYSRTPPPPTYESQSASSPYPSAAPTPTRAVYPRQSGRMCTYPSNGQGLPADVASAVFSIFI
eukprot:scaffold14609_cov139-Isochrysis_galbana.AAC.2